MSGKPARKRRLAGVRQVVPILPPPSGNDDGNGFRTDHSVGIAVSMLVTLRQAGAH